MKCRCCRSIVNEIFLDLNFTPFSNSYVLLKNNYIIEKNYSLCVYICTKCWFVQSSTINLPNEIFTKDYSYFSSTSTSFLKHSKNYVQKITKDLNLNKNNFVVEIASNDGYLLKNFIKLKIPNLGIEPAHSTAIKAKKKGISVIEDFFSLSLANKLLKSYKKADLIIANNVYAHVPDIIDFTKGIKRLLNKEGIVTIEFPHLLNLLKRNLYDTIYHEHYSYLSLSSVIKIFDKLKLKVCNVEKIGTQGGGLRVYGSHLKSRFNVHKSVQKILDEEINFGLQKLSTYKIFQKNVNRNKYQALQFLIKKKLAGNKIAAYGAAAKGNTFLNYAGITKDIIEVVFDAAESKQNKFLPRSHIPIISPSKIKKIKPDIIIILPWNIKDEIIELLKIKYKWSGVVVTFIPNLKSQKI